jgi:hypothetical protein
MLISDLTVEVRNSTLARVGQILPADLRGLELALRYNKIGGWKVSLRGDHPIVDTLRAPGSGLIVTGPTGVIISGPTASATYTKTSSDTTGTWEIIGTDDSIILGERLAYPVPSTDDLSLQTAAYDTRTGPAETVVKEYVAANMGASAPASRRITGLTVDTDLGRGETVNGNARFESLGALAESLLVTSSLGFDVIQNGSNLTFNVYEPVDRSGTIRMDVDNLRLTSSTYSYTSPVATRVIVGGSGDGAARILLERSSTESVAAETTWGRRIEVFSDSRSSSASVDLAQTGDEILTDKGKTIESISVKPSDDETMALGRDWGLGDKVTVVVGTLEVVKVVSEIAIAVTDDGIKIGATVGDPAVASASDPESVVISSMTNQEARISNLERNEVGVGAQKLVQYVKNATGASMSKGQAVYISGATGSNITIGLARANAESTSSKTLGLLAQDLANGEHGYVIVEGTLDGINTSGRTAGEAMWLSPTTAGGIIYGLAGKPSAPNHLVYLGVVKRVQSNNGSVYVHVQNGFELEELHNVSITSPANNNLLAYDSATSLWKNETAAEAGLSVVGHVHSGADITSGTVAIARGGTGVTTGAGIVPIVPSFMNYGSGSGSISSNGLVTFTNASFLASNSFFTSAYNRYRVMLDIQSCSVNDYVYWRGVDAATGNAVSPNSYNTGTVYQQSGSVMAYDNGNTTQTYSRIGYVTNDDGASYILDIFNPFQTRKTKGHFVSQYSASGLTNLTGAFTLNATTSLSGILFAPYNGANGNWTGTLRIFGVL